MSENQDVAALVEEARRYGERHGFRSDMIGHSVGIVDRLAAALASQARDLAAAREETGRLRQDLGLAEIAARQERELREAAERALAERDGEIERLRTDAGGLRTRIDEVSRDRDDAREATEALREEIRHACVSLTGLDGEGIVAAAERMREVLDDRENHRRAAWAFVEEMEAAAREALDIPRNPDPDIHVEPGDIRAAGERLKTRLGFA